LRQLFRMDYKYTISTPVLTSAQRREELSFLIELLNREGYHSVDILFGTFWGNDYGDWTAVSVKLTEIAKEISMAESVSTGSFEEDDFFVIINELKTEILFCHEYDIHLEYNEENNVTAAILEHWNIVGYEVKKRMSTSFHDESPQ
jgi:hypothetical protein